MGASADDVSAQIRSALALSDPELDTGVGSVTRKIIDAVAEQVGNAYVDTHLLTYAYDVDAKAGADLDAFTQLFGIARLPARRASGVVDFTRPGGTMTTAFIPIHTEVHDGSSPPTAVQTVAGAVMDPGVALVSVPVMALASGPAGNTPAGTVTVIASPLQGVSSVTNPQPLSGGADAESDSALRARWRKTVFRSLAGTEQMYLGVALDDPDCTAANVVGATKIRREQVQVSAGAATSTVADAQFVYTNPLTVGADIDDGVIALPGFDYTWNPTVPPSITVLNPLILPNGTIVDMEFAYTSTASRNSPSTNVTNRVDVWCGGSRPTAATQIVAIPTVPLVFNSTGGSPMNALNFARPDGAHPTVGNKLVPLALGPVLTVPATMTIAGTTYGCADTAGYALGTVTGGVTYAYGIVHDNTAAGYGPSSVYGLEWVAAQLPATGTVFTVGSGYTYNQIPASVQAGLDRWRLVGIDAQAHAARVRRLRFSLAAVYAPGVTISSVNTHIASALSTFIQGLGFDSVLRASDAITVVHGVPGVANCRFANGADWPGFTYGGANGYQVGVQQVNPAGTVTASYVDATGRPTDVMFGDADLPVLYSATVLARAENTFGAY